MLIFRADFFVPDCIWNEKLAPKVGTDFSVPSFGADFWSVCVLSFSS